MQGVVGLLIVIYCKFTKESSSEKILNRLRFDRIMAMSLWPHFFSPALYIVRCFLRNYVTDVNIALFPAKVSSDATRFSATSALKLWTSFYQTFSSQNRRQLNCRGRNIVCDRSPLYCIIWSVGCQFER